MISLAFSKIRTTPEGCLVSSREVYFPSGFTILDVVMETVQQSHKGENHVNSKENGKHDQRPVG
jgi:hypothetical protein